MTMHIPEFIGQLTMPEYPATPAEQLRRAIERAAADHLVSAGQIKSRRRGTASVSDARQDVYLALREAGWTLPRIGRALGRDHTTVMDGIARAKERRAEA